MPLDIFIEHTFGHWEYLLRIAVACICGGLIGWERSLRQKEAGIKTHIIVILGAALMMIVSKYGFPDVDMADKSRIAANIITGVSFLGAGMIFFRGGSIKGLTTAAGIWTTSGVGIAIGAGMYTVGLFSTAMIILIQVLLHRFGPSTEVLSIGEITFTATNSEAVLDKLNEKIKKYKIPVQAIKVTKNEDQTTTTKLQVKIMKNFKLHELISFSEIQEDIKEFSIREKE